MNKFNINVSNSIIGSQKIGKSESIFGWQDADLAIVEFAIPRIKKLRSETTTYPDDFENVNEWKLCLLNIITELEQYKEDRQSNYLYEFKKWFKHLWF